MPDLARAAQSLRKAATSTARATKSKGGSYKAVRLDYAEDLAAAAQAFLNGDNKNSTFRQATGIMLNAYTIAAIQGFQEGAEDKSAALEPEDELFLRQSQADEAGYIGGLWNDLAALKAKGVKAVPANRINSFVQSLDALFNAFKTRGAGKAMLEFAGPDGQESCKDCRRLKGKKHPAKWWIDNGLIPGQPGNENFECGSWRCQHFLADRNGKRFTL